jgi:hypothetical protein
MIHPTLITILIGVASMVAFLGIDWFAWSRCYDADLRRNTPMATPLERQRQEFGKAA